MRRRGPDGFGGGGGGDDDDDGRGRGGGALETLRLKRSVEVLRDALHECDGR